ncbi:hypothetical protein ACRZOL_000137 [Flavobacterium psychrophilum]|uniref:hypothetical protein n=1 Tax=Flavobacterium psychrophilum TaxID=96345 RepID=UPI000B7C4826|nr:hypothetical protein [Flavobacterium psychrophilum]EKT3965392.1 hypothetical protein [Flavobacterium psychrophilum]ELM3643242.1 hypothetical protein [Flavobacterium psychrophilum]SNA83820.1 conserved hypothetical protein [Flavobacterium psychrophilum]
MRFLIITQDLHITGTSQGIIERSFLSKLRIVYPEAHIDVLYLCTSNQEDHLEILPVNSILKKTINIKIPFAVKWINRLTSRLFHVLYAENYIHNQFAKEIKKIDYTLYDHIMVRSAGLNHETLLAMHNLPILKHAVVNFHDPYPYSWYKGLSLRVTNLELVRLQKMIQIVAQAKTCCASAYYMAKDLQYLYASNKCFYTLPHQFAFAGFDLSDKNMVRKKERKIQISYHGALMFGRDIFTLVAAFIQLMNQYDWIKNEVEMVLRVKGDGLEKLKQLVTGYNNIWVLETLNFSNSANEQIHESDITIVLENGPYYSNILGGKVPFLFALNKKVFISSPERSELKKHFPNYPFLADMNDLEDTKAKLYAVLTSHDRHEASTKQFFSDECFKTALDVILHNQTKLK